MDQLMIREFEPEDAEMMIEYIKRIGGETGNLTFGSEGLPLSVEDERKYITTVKEDPKSIMLGVWRGSDLIADGSISSMPRRMSHRAELGMAVVKDEWSKGIGSIILQRLIEFAKSAGIEIIGLEVRSDNVNAIHLYEKFGFKHIGTSPAFFKIDNEYYDFEIMYLDLRESQGQNI